MAKYRDMSKERLKKRAAEHIVGGMMGEGEALLWQQNQKVFSALPEATAFTAGLGFNEYCREQKPRII